MTTPEGAPSSSEQRAQRLSDKKDVSGRIGETSRYIGFGLVALVFTIHGSDSDLATGIRASNELMLNAAGLFGCLAIAADYAQYVAGYFSVNSALGNKDNDYRYDDREWSYWLRAKAFWAKQIMAGAGACLIIVAIALQILLGRG